VLHIDQKASHIAIWQLHDECFCIEIGPKNAEVIMPARRSWEEES